VGFFVSHNREAVFSLLFELYGSLAPPILFATELTELSDEVASND
jgi:hypothetical protein